MKKIFGYLALCAILFSAVACGGGDGSNEVKIEKNAFTGDVVLELPEGWSVKNTLEADATGRIDYDLSTWGVTYDPADTGLVLTLLKSTAISSGDKDIKLQASGDCEVALADGDKIKLTWTVGDTEKGILDNIFSGVETGTKTIELTVDGSTGKTATATTTSSITIASAGTLGSTNTATFTLSDCTIKASSPNFSNAAISVDTEGNFTKAPTITLEEDTSDTSKKTVKLTFKTGTAKENTGNAAITGNFTVTIPAAALTAADGGFVPAAGIKVELPYTISSTT